MKFEDSRLCHNRDIARWSRGECSPEYAKGTVRMLALDLMSALAYIEELEGKLRGIKTQLKTLKSQIEMELPLPAPKDAISPGKPSR